ncbi:hypothetical protein HK096_003380, partial [Nowakowskiella sp. JEL0078]
MEKGKEPNYGVDESVTLRIRCSVHFEKEYFITVLLHTTILKFKIILSDKFPSKPSPDDQRLIFAGKLLEDEDIIENILIKVCQYISSIVPTFHLVLKKPYSPLESELKSKSSILKSVKVSTFSSNSEAGTSLFSSNTTTSETIKYPFLAKLQNLNIPYQIVRVNGVLCALHRPLNLDSKLNSLSSSSSTLDNQSVPIEPNPIAEPLEQVEPVQPPPAAVPIINDEFGDAARAQIQNPVWLVAKLAFIVYLLSQGSSQERVFYLIFASVLIFLFQMGVIQWFVHRLPNVRRHQIPAENQAELVDNVQPPANQQHPPAPPGLL